MPKEYVLVITLHRLNLAHAFNVCLYCIRVIIWQDRGISPTLHHI